MCPKSICLIKNKCKGGEKAQINLCGVQAVAYSIQQTST